MLQEYWASTVIFIGIFSQCRQVHYISRFVYLGIKLLNESIFRQAHLFSLEKA